MPQLRGVGSVLNRETTIAKNVQYDISWKQPLLVADTFGSSRVIPGLKEDFQGTITPMGRGSKKAHEALMSGNVLTLTDGWELDFTVQSYDPSFGMYRIAPKSDFRYQASDSDQ